MLLTLSRGHEAAFAVALLTLVLGTVAMVVQPPREARAFAASVASLRPPPPTVYCTDDSGLVIADGEVRLHGLRIGTIDEVKAGTTRLAIVLLVEAARSNRGPMTGTSKLLLRHQASVPPDVVALVRTMAIAAGFDDLIVVVEGADHTQMIVAAL